MHAIPLAIGLLAFPGLAAAAASPQAICLERTGDAAAACLATAPGGGAPDTTAIRAAASERCSEETAVGLGYTGQNDIAARLTDACADFAADFRTLTAPPVPPVDGSPIDRCVDAATKVLAKLRARTITLYGTRCFVREARGKRCKRPQRDRVAAALVRAATRRLTRRCASPTDGLPRPALLAETAFDRARHFAQLVYPPNDLGPSAELGPSPVGVRTLELVDPSRPRLTDPLQGRPVSVEVWYPSTVEAVAGVPRYVVDLFGVDIAQTFTYRDVGRAPGPFPLVLFSHGNRGIRFQSVFLATLLASHGYVVASPDHHGNTFLDGVPDPDAAANRPLDMRFVLDELLARNATPGELLAGAIDASRIGMSGHSFGGYTTLALATGALADGRIGAFLPLAPASPFDAAFLGAIRAPILIMGGSLDRTTPFDSQQQAPFDLLPSGALVVGLANVVGAGHFTFSDVCEVPRTLVGLIGGFDEACTPAHLPWRHAHDVTGYLAHNFFDATLRGDAAALARLDDDALASIDDLEYRRK